MAKAPRGERLIIAIVGKRNAGKSSLINALTGQDIAIVSETAGTTTDPVAKPYELLPIGPVTIYDTAGIDDVGELGEKRVKSTRRILFRSDIAIVVVDQDGIDESVKTIVDEIQELKIPFVVAFNKIDLSDVKAQDIEFCETRGIPWKGVSSVNDDGVTELKEMMATIVPGEYLDEKVLIGDLIRAGDLVVLVTPIDLAAPKGRLILPQVQVLREILDNDAIGVIVKERELEDALRKLKREPDLVVTDSQVILKASGDVTPDIPLTTFSTVFARYKGDLDVFVDGAKKIDDLKDGDKVLIAEACSHHVQSDDIGRVKIPRWLRQYTGKDLDIEVVAGHDFPEDLEKYALVIHCGGCMMNRMEMMRRLRECTRRHVDVTNYGVAISKLHGVLDRVVEPFYS